MIIRMIQRVLYIFVPNESFGQALDILPKNFTFSKTAVFIYSSMIY